MNKDNATDKKPTIMVKVSGARGAGKTRLIERIERALKQDGYTLQKPIWMNRAAIWTSENNIIKIIENCKSHSKIEPDDGVK